MRKIHVLVAALVATLALGAASAAIAKPKKVGTTASASYKPGSSNEYENPVPPTFKVSLSADKKKCVKNRKVTVEAKGGGKVGSGTTSSSGVVKIAAPGATEGKYEVTVKKSKTKKLVCLGDSVTVKAS
jgi:hypothetical protein